jgi:hypothetical protein
LQGLGQDVTRIAELIGGIATASHDATYPSLDAVTH